MIPVLASQNITYPVIRWNIPVEEPGLEDVGIFNNNFYHPPYTHAWLNSSLPEFMTEDYALDKLSPYPVNSSLDIGNNTEERVDDISGQYPWTGPTILYEADLECKEANANPIPDDGSGIVRYNLTPKSKGSLGRLAT
ncbi:uncharacterized protein LAJ45_03683 [Morchella importuna]|uniref:uncharacterized protein n=1 Tax=Morchella importuna TaxID=1174673 RepID=UPI001E8E76D0|nr:uncharacterized protein LAJ45_03683 [Morchella importuna]KAH8152257.1 hypothetical protein LAJ45_03683 [Morchella importuna]